MNRIFLLILIGILYKNNRVLTLNNDLIQMEEDLIYSQLNNSINLKLFYEKLLQSNGIEHSIGLRHPITNEDIQQQTFLNKVNRFFSNDSPMNE